MNTTTIERIKQAVGIVKVMDHYGIDLRRAGRDLKGVCPFHEDHHPSLIVSPQKNICKCFACGDKAMDPAAFIMRKENCGYPEALRRMARMAGIDTCVYTDPDNRVRTITPPRRATQPPVSCFTTAEVEATLGQYELNPLCRFIGSKFGHEATRQAFSLYRVGTSSSWGGSAIFWQTDAQGRTRTGKVMAYDPVTGHRSKRHDGSAMMRWMHTGRGSGFNLRQCLFGEHLVADSNEVHIVESEKTALIAHLHFGGVWIATGGKSNMQALHRAGHLLRTRHVVLWPDADALESWQALAESLTRDGWWDVNVNPAAARLAPGTKSDIADIIVSHIQGS